MPLQQLEDIYIRSTDVPGLRPAPADIQRGELMTNVADQEVYVGDGQGGYFVVGAGAGAGGTPPDGDSIIVSGGTMSVNHLECGTFS